MIKIQSRTKNTILATTSGIVTQITVLILSFIGRSIFIYILGIEYLGISGLFSNILTVFSLAELGIGTAITYHYYQPIAKNDIEKIKSLTSFYKHSYQLVGIVIFFLGICFVPFLESVINFDVNININLYLIYLLYLLNTVSSYLFFSYKTSILTAYQRTDEINKITFISTIISFIIENFILIVFRDFIGSLIMKMLVIIVKNYLISRKANKLFPFIKEKEICKLPSYEIKSILKNVYAVSIIRISGIVYSSADNIIISSLIGTIYVGYNSNYILITAAITNFINIIKTSLIGSVGNLNAEESSEKKYLIYRKLDFMNFWIVSFCSVCLAVLLNPFIRLWIGEYCLFTDTTVYCIVLNFFLAGILNMVFLYFDTMGLFNYGKYYQLFGALLNIGLSIYLVKSMGVFGVFFASALTTLCTSIIPFTKIVFNYGFETSVIPQLVKFLQYLIITIINFIVVFFVTSLFGSISFLSFVCKALICIFLTNILLFLEFRKNESLLFFLAKLKSVVNRNNFSK